MCLLTTRMAQLISSTIQCGPPRGPLYQGAGFLNDIYNKYTFSFCFNSTCYVELILDSQAVVKKTIQRDLYPSLRVPQR